MPSHTLLGTCTRRLHLERDLAEAPGATAASTHPLWAARFLRERQPVASGPIVIGEVRQVHGAPGVIDVPRAYVFEN